MSRVVFFLLTISIFTACEQESLSMVDDALKPYFSAFEREAGLRGREVKLKDVELHAFLSADLPKNVAGQCVFNTQKPEEIKISTTVWARLSESEREYVIFHELGHCVLGKGHNDNADADGRCMSIMESGSAKCKHNYTQENRNKLLDELFAN